MFAQGFSGCTTAGEIFGIVKQVKCIYKFIRSALNKNLKCSVGMFMIKVLRYNEICRVVMVFIIIYGALASFQATTSPVFIWYV